jgi:L-iditol 2-dehydrogenase
MKFSANDLHYREIQILGTISQTIIDFQHAAELVSVRPDLFSSLVTQVIKAEHGQEAFERALDPHIHRVLVAFS